MCDFAQVRKCYKKNNIFLQKKTYTVWKGDNGQLFFAKSSGKGYCHQRHSYKTNVYQCLKINGYLTKSEKNKSSDGKTKRKIRIIGQKKALSS